MRISDWSSDVCSSDLVSLPHTCAASCSGASVMRRSATPFTQWLPASPGGGGAPARRDCPPVRDRKSVVSGKSVSVRVDLGGRRIIKKKHILYEYTIQESTSHRHPGIHLPITCY